MQKIMTKTALLCSVFAISLPNSAQAKEKKAPEFIFPLICTYDKDCWPVNYVDTNAKIGMAQDYKCGANAQDDHKGTDFALTSAAQMNNGVDVIAVADGEVLRVRDGESDHLKTEEELKELKANKKECGNGILIDHGNGLQTIYCHLKQNSITVKKKQKIKSGEKIGEVGQSGEAEYPKLHFGVVWEGGIIDPYTGKTSAQNCSEETKTPLWHSALGIDYVPAAIFNGGFSETTPDFESIHRGKEPPTSINKNSAALVFWTGVYNVQEGDEITLTIIDTEGKIFAQTKRTQKETRDRQYYFTGRKIGKVQLEAGTYKAESILVRNKNSETPLIKKRAFSVLVE